MANQHNDQETKSESDSDDDLQQVVAAQRSLPVPLIKTVKQAKEWLSKPQKERKATASVCMCLLSKKQFTRGWFLTLIDYKRATRFDEAKEMLESLPFSLRKDYILSLVLYLVPFGSKEPETIPSVPYHEGDILHCKHVTGFKIDAQSGIPKCNISSMDRIILERASSSAANLAENPARPPSTTTTMPLLTSSLVEPTLANNSPKTLCPENRAPSISMEAAGNPTAGSSTEKTSPPPVTTTSKQSLTTPLIQSPLAPVSNPPKTIRSTQNETTAVHSSLTTAKSKKHEEVLPLNGTSSKKQQKKREAKTALPEPNPKRQRPVSGPPFFLVTNQFKNLADSLAPKL